MSVTKIDPNPECHDISIDITRVTFDLAGSHWEVMEDTAIDHLPKTINIELNDQRSLCPRNHASVSKRLAGTVSGKALHPTK